MNRLTLVSISLTTVALAAAGRPAAACGGFFRDSQTSEVATLSDIRVLIVRTPGHVDQLVQVRYGGKATRFAWVYPVAANPVVEEVKEPIFDSLEKSTRPKIYIQTMGEGDDGGGGWGCGSDSLKAGDRSNYEEPPVEVWQKGQVGAFDYVVVTATSAQDMLDWLNTNGFAVPPTAKDVLAHYVALKWFFVAMKVSVQSAVSGVPSTTTVRLGYAASEVRYPLRMVSLSPAAATSLEIYLVSGSSSEELVPDAPFTELDIDPSAVKALSPSTHNYDQVFADTLKKGGMRSLVREASLPWSIATSLSFIPSGAILTRLRTRLGPDGMDQDLVFSPKAYRNLYPTYSVLYDSRELKPSSVSPLLALLALALYLRRRPH